MEDADAAVFARTLVGLIALNISRIFPKVLAISEILVNLGSPTGDFDLSTYLFEKHYMFAFFYFDLSSFSKSLVKSAIFSTRLSIYASIYTCF